MVNKRKITMGVIVGNRGFFPDHLAKSGREEMIGILEKSGVRVIAPTTEETKYGAVESRDESRTVALSSFRRPSYSPAMNPLANGDRWPAFFRQEIGLEIPRKEDDAARRLRGRHTIRTPDRAV